MPTDIGIIFFASAFGSIQLILSKKCANSSIFNNFVLFLQIDMRFFVYLD